MEYWLQWNAYAAARADRRWRIEDRDDHGLGKNINSRDHEQWTWADLEAADAKLCAQVKALAEDYGYEAS
jgi:hypothetical protein